jgi:hypothetical protein
MHTGVFYGARKPKTRTGRQAARGNESSESKLTKVEKTAKAKKQNRTPTMSPL